MYHCRDCFNVFHLRCIKAWAQQRMGRNPLSFQTWPCPMCKCESDRIPQISCWCGKSKVSTECASTCEVLGDCLHGKLKKCIKDCHPGPCEYHCESSCANLQVREINKPPTAWENIRRRWRSAPLTLKKKVTSLGSLLAVILISTQIYCYFFARWNVMPYRYLGFGRKYGFVMELATFIGGIFFTMCLGLLSLQVFEASHRLFCHALDLKDLSTNRGRKLFTSQLAFVILLVAGSFSACSIVIGYVP